MLKAIALDDEPLPLEILQTFCDRIPEEIQLVKIFSKVTDAKQFLELEQVDLIFLDVQMPLLSGIEFYKLFGKNKLLILTTAFSEFALEGFNLEAVDYLLKPFDFERFKKSVDKASRHFAMQSSQKDESFIWVKVDSKHVKIELEKVVYIEGMADYLRIHFDDGKPIVTRMTMKKMIENLDSNFLRIHKSFIIREDKITAKSSKEVHLGEVTLPISASYNL
ncbi:LytR/AlgR family response regulator transcription factor [Algoriphagus sp. PAP.12]|uniref:LytR/AlgR family response regulator transcription factor n=1 Tax=Algoriphagus sp. PAP.12 TaxID=2996678 RepID=UPI00227B0DA8|nr:response regulator transcription factor [Algoriphagus sp. PAP.12]